MNLQSPSTLNATATNMATTANDARALAALRNGAMRDPKAAIQKVGDAVEKALDALAGMAPDDLRAQRKERFYAIGREGLA
mgnify:CR=1 FL=1